MASTAAPPDSAPPHPVVIPEIVTDRQPGVEDEDDSTPIFPNRYADIDNKAIGSDFEMPASANPVAIKLFRINYTYYFTIIRDYISIISYYFNYSILTVPTIIRYYSNLATWTIIPIISLPIIPINFF